MASYTGNTERELKTRVSIHNNTFRDKGKRMNTVLAKKVHALTEAGNNITIEWNILERSPSHKPGYDYCRLCTMEKYHIIFKRDQYSVNNIRTEECRHKSKRFLSNFKDQLSSTTKKIINNFLLLH